MVSNRATTSGFMYFGEPISYRSCDVTVPIDTCPPVPGCLVITDDPSAATSAMGNPGWVRSAISVKKL
jgi:hypothetical protein